VVHKLTEGIIFTMQFPMATVKKNALYKYIRMKKNIIKIRNSQNNNSKS
jgi:hypothetical protein